MNLNSNWLKDLRVELFRRMYEEPIHPKNLWLERSRSSTPRSTRSTARTSAGCIERGTFTAPARRFAGARYIAPSDDPAETDWESIRNLWRKS